MLNKLHVQEQQATHAQCLALLVEFTTAVRAQKVCLMCGAKIAGGSDAHTPDCAIRRADVFVRTRIRDSARSGLIDGAATDRVISDSAHYARKAQQPPHR
jgi:hypothetical protein